MADPQTLIDQARARQEKQLRNGNAGADALIQQARQRRQQEAGSALYATSEIKPDDAAGALDQSEQIGVPFEFAARNRVEIEADATAKRIREQLMSSPSTAAFVSEPANAAVSSDSIAELAEMEKLIRERNNRRGAAGQAIDLPKSFGAGFLSLFGSGVRGLGESARTATVQARNVAEDMFGERGRVSLEASATLARNFPIFGQLVDSPNTLMDAGGDLAETAETIRPEQQGIEDFIAEGLGQIAGAVTATALTRSPAPMIAIFTGAGVDQQAQRMRSLGIDPADKPLTLAGGGAITGGSEFIRLGSLMRMLPPSVRNRAASSALGRITRQAGEEAVQETIEGVSQNLLAMGYDPEAEILEGAGTAGTAAGAAAVFQGLVEIALPGRARQVRAQDYGEAMTQVRDQVEKTPLFQRRRKSMESYLSQAQDGDKVFLDGNGVTELYQSGALQTLRALGLTDTEISEAFGGSDIEIEAARLQTVEDRAQFEELLNITRRTPDDMTLAEQANEAFDAALRLDYQELLAEMQDEQQALEGFEEVQQAVNDQLLNAGRSIEEAQAAAAVWGSMFRTLAERGGVDEGQVFERLRLRIEGPGETARRVDDVDLALEDLRKGAIPTEQEAYGQSLQDLARESGLTVERGETELLDTEMDNFAEKAWGEGYFQERPDAETLRTALYGDPLYVENNRNADVAARREQLLQLQEDLQNRSIDLGQDNDAIRSSLEEGGVTLNQSAPDTDRILNQPDGSGPARASVIVPSDGVLGNEETLVRIGAAADKTSFLHESAHIFLEIYQSLEGESPAVASEMQAVRDWLKAKPGETLTRAQHETFAESFEIYLMDGKAPSAELRSVFRRFRAWFTRVYRDLRDKLPRLNAQARDLFDRMLATDMEIAHTRNQYAGKLSARMQGLMTPEQVDAYSAAAEKAGHIAQERLFRKHVEEIRRREARQYKANRKKVEEEVRSEILSRPAYQAYQAFMSGAQRLDRSAIVEMRGESAPKAMPRGKQAVYTKEGGVHPDLVAHEYGFTSGDQLVKALIGAPRPEEMIKAETDRIMRERYGDIELDGTIEREAVAAVFNSPAVRMMQAEADALAQQAGKQSLPLQAITAEAERRISAKPIREVITPGRYAIKARDLHKKALRASAKEDWEDALRFTRQAMLQHEMARKAYKARDEIERGNRALARFAAHRKLDPKKIDPDFIGHIRVLMAMPGADNQPEGAAALRNFADEQVKEGRPVRLPSDIVLGRTMPERRGMTLEQFREFKGAVQNLNKIGRDLSEEARAERRAEFDAIAASIRENAGEKHKKGRFEQEGKTMLAKLQTGAHDWMANLRKLPYLARVLDGGPDSFGSFYKAVVLPLREAGGRELELKYENQQAVNEILRKHGLKLGKRVYVTAFDQTMSMEQLWALALNMGNESNIERLLSDPNFDFTEQTLRAAFDEHLTQNYWDAAQEVWDFIDSRWPDIAELEKRTTGVAPAKVEARTVQTRFGAYRGGYYPLKYDPAYEEGGRPAPEGANEFDAQVVRGGVLGRTQTRHGHTITRQDGVKRSVFLSMNVLTQHLDEVAHDLAYREAFNRTATVVNDPSVSQAIRDAIGPANLKAVREIIERVATGQIVPRNATEKLLRGLRVNAASADLGLNIRTMLTQPLGLTQTFAKLGTKTTARGVAEYLSDVPGSVRMAYEKSDFLRNRQRVITRDMRDALSGENSRGAFNRMRAWAMIPMQQVDAYGVAVPTWIAAYREKLDETGNETESVLYADGIVADTQGSGLTLDLATIQSGGETAKIFSYMYGYFSTTLNLTFESGALMRRHPARAVMSLLAIYSIPGVLAEVVLEGLAGDDDDNPEVRLLKTVLMGHVNQATATLPGVREVASAIRYRSGQETFFGRLTRGIAGMSNDVVKIIEEGEIDAERGHRMVENTLRTGGVMFGIPGASTMARLYDTVTQDDDPTVTEAFLTGKDDDN